MRDSEALQWGASLGLCGWGSGLRTLRSLGFPCQPAPSGPATGQSVGLPSLSARQAPQSKSEEIPRILLRGSRGAGGAYECPLTPAPLGRPLRGMFHTQGCEGLDTGVTRLSTLLGLWPWGEEQAHSIRPLSRPPHYIVSPRPGNKGFTRPSA